MTDRIGFLGLGIMGRPMAANLLRAGVPLAVWNRSRPALDELAALGAEPVGSVAELLERSDVVLMMLGGEAAIDATLGPDDAPLPGPVAGRVLVNLGTVSPERSQRLAERLRRAGGELVEAPVSGSRVPAEQGALVGMIAGAEATVARVVPLLAPLCAGVTRCGPIPGALRMKLAANVFLIATVTGLAESFAFASRLGLDLAALRGILDAGQMASPISRLKTAKLVAGDLGPQAAIADVLTNARLIASTAEAAGIATPLTDAAGRLYAAAAARGDGGLDMIAVERAIAGLPR